MQMSQKEISLYYKTLTNGEKGQFTAYVSCKLGSSPHTWQQKFLSWSKGNYGRPISPIIKSELWEIIEKRLWQANN